MAVGVHPEQCAAGDELGVSISTAYKWSAAGARSGRFRRHTKLPNGAIRIRRDWLDAWLADHEAS